MRGKAAEFTTIITTTERLFGISLLLSFVRELMTFWDFPSLASSLARVKILTGDFEVHQGGAAVEDGLDPGVGHPRRPVHG